MYNVGDKVVYGESGVCRIVEISEKNITGENELYYTMEPCYQGYMIYAPVENCKVYMRPIISKDEAINLIDDIPSIEEGAFQCHTLREQIEHYESLVKTHSLKDLFRLTTSIHHKKAEAQAAKRKLGAVDEKFMKRAEDLLFGELAMALDIPRADVSKFIEERLGKIS